jgi:hypothetical protein
MVDKLRTPLFIIAIILMVLTVMFELGAGIALPNLTAPNPQERNVLEIIPADSPAREEAIKDPELLNKSKQLESKPPGLAITYMALLDGIVLFTVGLMGIALIMPEKIQGRLQGCVTFIFGLLLIIACIILIFIALGLLLLMVSLFLSVPFGTIAYFAIFGFFDRGGSTTALALIMFLKLGFVICLILAQQRFIQNKGLVLLLLTSLLANVIISFLHGIVPSFLVSITDALAAIIVAILAVIWLIFLLFGSLLGIIKAVI